MKILYLALGDDYGDPSGGPSFEELNFHGTLRRMPHDVIHWDFARELMADGYERANERLWSLVGEQEPDVLFCVLFDEQLNEKVIQRISEETRTVTVNWFCDDHWRFDGYSKYWAPKFDWVVTTWPPAVARYREMGYDNVILSQWACNHFDYFPRGNNLSYDVTFVGQPHSNRRGAIDRLRQRGFSVRTWGRGWEEGRIDHDEMLEVFSGSRINLNFANSSIRRPGWRRKKVPAQIKGRVFEVPGCGGLLLTEYAQGLEDFYRLDQEIVAFRSYRELESKVGYLLSHEEERAEIASRGYQRTLREHTFEMRLEAIFDRIGVGRS